MAKLIKTASGKQTIKMSKSQWQKVGINAGWIKKQAKFSINQSQVNVIAKQVMENKLVKKNINGVNFIFQITNPVSYKQNPQKKGYQGQNKTIGELQARGINDRNQIVIGFKMRDDKDFNSVFRMVFSTLEYTFNDELRGRIEN